MNYPSFLILLASICNLPLLAMESKVNKLELGKTLSKAAKGQEKVVEDGDTTDAGLANLTKSMAALKTEEQSAAPTVHEPKALTLVKKPEEKSVETLPFPPSVAYFDRDVWKEIMKLVEAETKGIWAAIYHCNYPLLAERWSEAIKAKKLRGCFLLSREYEDEAGKEWKEEHEILNRCNASGLLIKRVNRLNGIANSEMHNKFVIFESNGDRGPVLVMGSFNATNAAAKYHFEDCVFIYDPAIIAFYVQEFKRMYSDSVPLDKSKVNPKECELPFRQPKELPSGMFPQVKFRDTIKELVLNLISWENEAINGAQFIVISSDIAKAWMNHEKKIKGSLLVDPSYKSQDLGALRILFQAGVSLFVLTKPFFIRANGKPSNNNRKVHHKFLIFERNRNKCPLLLTGSANLSDKSHLENWENGFVTEDLSLIKHFSTALVNLKNDGDTKTILAADLEDSQIKVQPNWNLNGYAFSDETD